MTRKSLSFCSVGLITLAAASLAATRVDPVEAKPPSDATIPAAESVEVVLRASYSLPAYRAEQLATFLKANASPGIDVRFEKDRLTVVAPADAQKALGSFIDLCVSKDSVGLNPIVPTPADPLFGEPPTGDLGVDPFSGVPPKPVPTKAPLRG